jgi:putative tricarboxylic transport membrane protein
MEVISTLGPSFYIFIVIGTFLGILFGAIPGMTATMAVAVFLPVTYAFGLKGALAWLLGLYVGGIAGGMIPTVLINLPGTPSSICTTFDGYPMARQGKPVQALKIGITASLFGGLFSAAILYFLAPVLSNIAIEFSYVEKFLIILLALTIIASLSKSILMGFFSGILGIWLSLIGVFPVTEGGNGKTRLMFGFMKEFLHNGFALLPVLIGLFGIALILSEVESTQNGKTNDNSVWKNTNDSFSFKVFHGRFINLIRSASIGTFVGILPGVGGSTCSILSYTQEKNFARDTSMMGQGAPQGIIASETSNNALTGGALVPLLSLGIPGDSTTAVLIGAFTLQGIQVGPLFISQNLDTWNAIIIALVLANLVMFVMMFFAIRYISKIVHVAKYIMYPIIIMMCSIGGYAIHFGLISDLWTVLIFGIFGYVAVKLGIEIVPLIIGFILGPLAEVFFVKTLATFGNFTIFFTKSYIAIALWVLIVISIALPVYTQKKKNQG